MLPAVVLRGLVRALVVLTLLAAAPFATVTPAFGDTPSWEVTAPDAVDPAPRTAHAAATLIAPAPPLHVPRTLVAPVPPPAMVGAASARLPPPPAWRRVARLRSDGTSDP